MGFLLLVSILWAFSFGLIKTNLGSLDPNFVAFARLFLSFLVFVPFMRIKSIPGKTITGLILTGAIQFGGMYIAYTTSFQHLKSYEVALFTILTPLYVVIIDAIFSKKLYIPFILTSFGAIIGTGMVQGVAFSGSEIWIGFLIVQLSNICFALGQVNYRRLLIHQPAIKDHQIFSLLYLGGFIASGFSALLIGDLCKMVPNTSQALSLIYLGIIPSGLGFFLWNYGARKTNAGTLAIFNDLKIPLAITVSIIVFNEELDWFSLGIGTTIVLFSLLINEFLVKRKKSVNSFHVK